MVAVDRGTSRLAVLLLGAIPIAAFFVEIYVRPLFVSNAASLLFTVLLPIAFGAAVTAGVAYDGRSPVTLLVGAVAVVTVLVGLWSLYGYYSADGGVFFGGLLTSLASFVLFACVLGCEIHRRMTDDGRTRFERTTEGR